jgi:hypothetical protein
MTTPKLNKPVSDLMLAGSKMVKPTRDTFFQRKGNFEHGQVTHACAIGMAAVAYAESLDPRKCFAAKNRIEDYLSNIYVHTKDHPVSPHTDLPVSVTEFVIHLMDDRDWPVGRIANWLKSLGL